MPAGNRTAPPHTHGRRRRRMGGRPCAEILNVPQGRLPGAASSPGSKSKRESPGGNEPSSGAVLAGPAGTGPSSRRAVGRAGTIWKRGPCREDSVWGPSASCSHPACVSPWANAPRAGGCPRGLVAVTSFLPSQLRAALAGLRFVLGVSTPSSSQTKGRLPVGVQTPRTPHCVTADEPGGPRSSSLVSSLLFWPGGLCAGALPSPALGVQTRRLEMKLRTSAFIETLLLPARLRLTHKQRLSVSGDRCLKRWPGRVTAAGGPERQVSVGEKPPPENRPPVTVPRLFTPTTKTRRSRGGLARGGPR